MAENKDRIILDVAYQPQVKTERDTKSIMLDVIIALIPALAIAVTQFGWKLLVPVAASTASAVFFEWAYRKLMHKDCRIGDLSACVTGLLLGMVLPPSTPWWLPIVGSFFAIVVVKQLYGGIGKNFLNPALAGRAFLLASYSGIMGIYAVPSALARAGVDAETMATPLTYLYAGSALPAYMKGKALFLGAVPGCIGEISKLAILIGLVYLLVRKVITWHIPVSFTGTVFLLSLIFGHEGYTNGEWAWLNAISGSVLFAAVFMATDYSTSPVTLPGQLLFGFGCGVLTVLIRYFGGYPEGSTYAVLIMNLCAWAIDKAFRRYQFGVNKNQVKALKKADKYERLAKQYREKAGE